MDSNHFVLLWESIQGSRVKREEKEEEKNKNKAYVNKQILRKQSCIIFNVLKHKYFTEQMFILFPKILIVQASIETAHMQFPLW